MSEKLDEVDRGIMEHLNVYIEVEYLAKDLAGTTSGQAVITLSY